MISSSSVYRIGRYTLHQEFASGGMGSVHFGLVHAQGGFCRVVAIKALRASEEEEATRKIMMLDEARLAGRIRHPNVVPVLDVLAEKDRLYLVMEYVHGEPLSRLLSRSRARELGVPSDILVTVLVDALRGLHAAHEAVDRDGNPLGLVHRDVSPQNILVGKDGLSRIVDFGVAKAKGRLQATTRGDVKGKVAYMAPEQVKGMDVDRRADVYAAGIILWEGIAGRGMHDGFEEPALLGRVLLGEIEAPSAVTGKEEPLEAVAMRALATPVEERFASALEMAEALSQVISPASAMQVSAWVEGLFREELAEREIALRELEAEAERVSLLPSSGERISAVAQTREAECSEPTVGAVQTMGSVNAPPHRMGAWVAILAGASFAALLAAVTALTLARGGAAADDEQTTGRSDGEPVLAASAGPKADVSTVQDASISQASPAASASATAAVPAPVRSARVPRVYEPTPKPKDSAKAPVRTDCDPPYTFDEQGNRKYKLECL